MRSFFFQRNKQADSACLLRWKKFSRFVLFVVANAVSSGPEVPPAPEQGLRGPPAVISTADGELPSDFGQAGDFGQVGDLHVRDSETGANPSSLAASSFLDDSDSDHGAPPSSPTAHHECRSSPTTRLLIVMRHPPKISDPYNFGALFKETSEKPEFAQACAGVKENACPHAGACACAGVKECGSLRKCEEYLKKVFVYEASASQVGRVCDYYPAGLHGTRPTTTLQVCMVLICSAPRRRTIVLVSLLGVCQMISFCPNVL